MEWVYLSEDYAATAQIQIEDIPYMVEEGFKSVLNNRPDHEGPDQPLSDNVAKALDAAGIQYAYNPVSPSGLTAENIQALTDQMASMPKPILAYCRTGNRSSILFNSL